ncbi:MAG: InlB B-repeat-containing protein, partial [Opitutaceae bacterium]|nr:InlB B-repeat-containing protein [Opitutaceae bacterium]
TFSITDDTTLWAVFKKVKRLTLRADPSSVGTATVVGASNDSMVTVNAAQGTYEFDPGTIVTISAVSTSAYTFREWVGLVASGSSPETTVVMEEDRVVVARFELMEFRDLTINVSPAGVGAVSVRGEASITDSRTISCGKDTVVMLTAAATMPGYEFTGWSGDASGASPGVYVTMDEPRTVTASFARALYNVTARPQIAGRGTVTMTSAGHADVVNDTGRYYYDEEVTLTAVEAPGYRFVDWVANVGGLALPVASSTGPIRVTGAMIIEARFEHAGTEGVLVNVSGGSVLSRVQSEPDANGDYIEEITFAPDAYHEFTTLDGDAYNYEHLSNGNLKCWVWVPKGGGFQSVTATFTLTSFTATAESDPAGAGEVQILVEGEDHSFRREEGGPLYYPAGTLLRFMANETRDWEFNSWANIEGEILDSSNPKSVLVKVTKDISAKARFDPMKRSRTVTLMMDFMNGAVCEDASITMGDATHKWNDGAIIKTFREGESVNASCEVLDDRGLPVPFKVERWDGPFLATIGDDGTRSTVAGTMLAEDVTLVVNITRIKAILQTMSATWMLNGTLQDETSIISDGGLITVGDMYEMGTEAMVWLSVKPGYYLAMDKGDDGWTLTPDGIRLQGRESAFVPFEVATHGTWTGGNDDTDALDPKIKHPHYREYDQDADGNYIVPGYDGTLVIKYTDPSLPAPDFTDPAVISDPSKWRQYGKRVRLDSEKTEIKAKTTEDEFFARRAGEYFLDTDSPVKLDSRRDKSGNLLIRGGVETTPAP